MKKKFLQGHHIFLVDALGACLSILLLFFLYANEALFGMPQSVLLHLILIAAILATYSFSCYFFKPNNWRLYLFIIAILNSIYCLLTIYQLFQNSQSITVYGLVYFVGVYCEDVSKWHLNIWFDNDWQEFKVNTMEDIEMICLAKEAPHYYKMI